MLCTSYWELVGCSLRRELSVDLRRLDLRGSVLYTVDRCMVPLFATSVASPTRHNLPHSEQTKESEGLLGRPYGSTGGLIFCPWYFFYLAHHISELPRPIVVKLCHMIGKWLNFITQVQTFGGAPPKKFGDQKHAKFWSILYSLGLWSRISETAQDIQNLKEN